MMTIDDFNDKYEEYLGEGHYGLSIANQKVIEFLDDIFQDLTKIPDFKYYQIKMKFGYSRFYADNVGEKLSSLIERQINRLIKDDESKT